MQTSLTWLARLTGSATDADWRRLVGVYGPLLKGWMSRAHVPPDDHDDLVQEVLMVVVRRVGEFDRRGPGAFRAWLRVIVANQARKFFRDRRLAEPADLDAIADPESVLGRQWDREHDEYLAARAMRAVEGDFAPATWQAFQRQVIEGRGAAEVATELGLSVNAVVLARGRVLKRLRAELEGLVD